MKRRFVSVLWGDFLWDESRKETCDMLKEKFDFDYHDLERRGKLNKLIVRRKKIQRNMANFALQPYSKESTVYVFGKHNYDLVKNLGIDAVLFHDEPYKFHPSRRIYLHKLDAYRQIMRDFDEVVLLDFDMIQSKKLPSNFWELLGQKSKVQASIHSYRRSRINTREQKKANKLISAGAFLYLRGNDLGDRLWELNRSGTNKWSCEPAISYLTDEISGGWKNQDFYFENHEPIFYSSPGCPFRNPELYPKNICFSHGHYTRRVKKPGWLIKEEKNARRGNI